MTFTRGEWAMLLVALALIAAGIALLGPWTVQIMDVQASADALRRCADVAGCYAA